MCTVSFVRTAESVIITSNRDENIQRQKAAAPGFHDLHNKRIIFPKDTRAGGTWFAAGSNGVVTVLLNGAFVKHIPKPPYRKSRGLILLDIIESDTPFLFFRQMDLSDIEPFTIILYEAGNLYELRWDGKDRFERSMGNTNNHIWSSSTLYSDDITAMRKGLFEQFIQDANVLTAEGVYGFHNYNHGDEENGFVISRQSGMRTFSITQAVITAGEIKFLHTDLLQHQQFETVMHIGEASIKS